MSREQFLSFLEAVTADADLQEKLMDAGESDAVAAIAQSAGYESVSPELVTDFLEFVATQSTSEQEGEQQLSAVSGGMSNAGKIATIVTSSVAGVAVAGVAGYYSYKSQGKISTESQGSNTNYDKFYGCIPVQPRAEELFDRWKNSGYIHSCY